MPGTLFIVATPIGNLEDITFRAVRVLREVAVIAAEDTRHSAKLLMRYGITTPTISYHEHNSRSRLPQLLDRLLAGEHVALVTDAGTPSVSDPGTDLVSACIAASIPVDPVPGSNAPLAAAVASGFPITPLTILGFAPSKAAARRQWLFQVATIPHTCCFFEAPTRIVESIEDIAMTMGERPICVARELTKVHQQFLRGSAASVLGELTDLKGEFTVVVGPRPAAAEQDLPATDEQIVLEFRRMTEESPGSRRREIIAILARQFNRRSSDVYSIVERQRTSVE